MKIELFSHNLGKEVLERQKPNIYEEVMEAVSNYSPSEYSSPVIKEDLRGIFKNKNWEWNGKLVKSLPLRFGFRKSRVQVETQFGNVSRYYTDIIKLQIAKNEGEISFGILILPTQDLADKLGSNVAYFERAKKELPYIEDSIELGIFLIGLKL